MRLFALALAVGLSAPSHAGAEGVNVTIPLVEKALRFLQTSALSPSPEAAMLRAGVLRVCGEKMEGPGCKIHGFKPPAEGTFGPDANRAWRHILESALAAASLSSEDFDKTVFQRYIMDAMVESLDDPASFYILPSVYKKISSIPSDFVGFGLRVAPQNDHLEILAVHEGSPAWDAGLLHGEKIIKVNGQGVTGVRRPIALASIWGADGEKVSLTVKRAGGATREIEITYKPWQFDAHRVERRGDISVVTIKYFGSGVADAVEDELAGTPMGLVLDLRDAAGGDEGEMVAIADLLLAEGSIGEKKMRGKLGSRRWEARPDTDRERLDLPTAIVVNSGTSGLAEVLSMTMRRHNRAILIGRRTAGIDTMETIRPFKDGSAIQVTSTRLLGPDSATIAKGVLPHVKTNRGSVVSLAAQVLELAKGHDMESLLEAAQKAVKLP